MVRKDVKIGQWRVVLDDTHVQVFFKEDLTGYSHHFGMNGLLERQATLIKAENYFKQCVANLTQMENHYTTAMRDLGIEPT